MRTVIVFALLSALVLRAGSVGAQAAPWDTNATAPPPSAPPPPAEPAPDTSEHYATTPDPAFSYNFQMPTARPLRRGDTMLTVAGDLGFAGARYGFTRHFDAGIGVPFYLAGVSVDARYALILGNGAALSVFAYVTVPFLPGNSNAASFLGFTWQGGGAAWMLGPVASIWGSRAGIHLGVNVAQRILLGGAWIVTHLTVEGRITDAVRAIAQCVVMAEAVAESGTTNAHVLDGNGRPRVFPYVIGGLRLHSRRFAVDFGILVALAGDSPLSSEGGVGVWPWTSVSQTF